jgi:oligopeptide/dipeptide ABC transporter ATP-binding protein
MSDSNVILRATDLTKHFVGHQSILGKIRKQQPLSIPAVDCVTFELRAGETVGLVGESGCGKSTLGRTLVGLYPATSGALELFGQPISNERTLEQRRAVQMIFQDPFASLNPRMSVGQMLKEVILFHQLLPKEKVEERCKELMTLVGLPHSALDSYPRQFSGGQRQRIGIARALALQPKILIADEAVSALDVSVQASIVNLLEDLKRDLGLSMLFISHNISVVRQISDRVCVMYLGRVVEEGNATQVFDNPVHPYTKLLLDSVPKITPGSKLGEALAGELPSMAQKFVGCRFRSRCQVSIDICATIDPQLVPISNGEHSAACLLHASFK